MGTCIECGFEDPAHDQSCDTGVSIERDLLLAEVAELKAKHIASQTGDMLKMMFETLLRTSEDTGAKNYMACHIEWDDGVFARLNLPFQRIQFALIRPGMQSPTEKLAFAEGRAVVAERERDQLRIDLAAALAGKETT